MSAYSDLLPLFKGVRQIGPNQSIALCSAHEDKSPSLSIKQVDDRVLMHCFAGCPTLSVLEAVGRSMADLFDKPLSHHIGPITPQQRREWHDKAKTALWKACRDDLITEMNILLLAAGDIYRGHELSKDEMARMLLAGKRWRNALGEL